MLDPLLLFITDTPAHTVGDKVLSYEASNLIAGALGKSYQLSVRYKTVAALATKTQAKFVPGLLKQSNQSPEIVSLWNRLTALIEEINPDVLVLLEDLPAKVLLNRIGIMNMRGSIYKALFKNIPTVVTQNPEKIRFLGPEKAMFGFDVRKAASLAHGRIPVLEEHIIIEPTPTEALEYLKPRRNQMLSFDIEVYNKHMSCISFSWDATSAISIPFITQTGHDYYSLEDEAKIWRQIAALLGDPTIVKAAQNSFFDFNFLYQLYGIKIQGTLHDTMIAQAIYMPDLKKGLGTIASLYTNIPYYKDEGKEFMLKKVGDIEQFWRYNAKDSLTVSQALPVLLARLTKQGNLTTYQRQIALLQPLVYMASRGLLVGTDNLKRAADKLQAEIEHIKQDLQLLVGLDFNPGSSAQAKQYFYETRKIKPYVSRSTGKPTTNETALQRLARNPDVQAARVARLLMDFREKQKLHGTYYTSQLDPDGRIRCSFNPVGARTGRLSSSKSIFGTGMNMQNQPRGMKQFYRIDEGYLGVEMDLSQAENRMVAYISGDPEMIHAFEAGVDIHSKTATAIFGGPVDKKHHDGIKAAIGYGGHTQRDWGKRANHGLNYGMEFRKAALLWEIPEKDARGIVDKYHETYPYVRKWHAEIRRALALRGQVENIFGRKYTFLDDLSIDTYMAAYAFGPQSAIADLINQRGLVFIYNNPRLQYVDLLLQVHDSITFQIPLALGEEQILWTIKTIEDSLQTPINHNNYSFSIPVDTKIGITTFGALRALPLHQEERPLFLTQMLAA